MNTKAVMKVCLFAMVSLCAEAADASLINFDGITKPLVESPAGQNFAYAAGSSLPSGVVNVRRLSGDELTLTSSGNAYPHGIYVSQRTPNLNPLTLRLTFSGVETLLVGQNETLTSREINRFQTSGSAWQVVSLSLATISGSGTNISITGTDTAPFGDYTIQTTANSFDFTIQNATDGVLDTFGSGIYINVLPEPAVLAPGLITALFVRRRAV